LKSDYGFITPLDMGKRAVFEYDYYFDHTDEAEIIKMQKAMMDAGVMIASMCRRHNTIYGSKTYLIRDFP
jgi:hypothetical protein